MIFVRDLICGGGGIGDCKGGRFGRFDSFLIEMIDFGDRFDKFFDGVDRFDLELTDF